MKQMNVHKNVKLAKKPPLRGGAFAEQCRRKMLQTTCRLLKHFKYRTVRRLPDLQKLFIHGQPALQGPSLFANCQLPTANRFRSFAANNRNDAVPKNLFALNPIICYNQIMSDSNFEINNLDLEKRSVNAKAYKEKISHAIL
jgi:hypothetical protein